MVYIYTPSSAYNSEKFLPVLLSYAPKRAQLSFHTLVFTVGAVLGEEMSPQSRVVFGPGFDPWREAEGSGDRKTFKGDYYSCLAVKELSVSDKNLLQ